MTNKICVGICKVINIRETKSLQIFTATITNILTMRHFTTCVKITEFFLQDRNWCPNCTNKLINHYSTSIYKRWTHIITTVNCLKPSALKLHFPLLTCTHKVYIKTAFTHVLHNISSLETPR
jgi:hypothetical protein